MVGTPKVVMRLGGVLSGLAVLVALAGVGVGVVALTRGDTTTGVWWLILFEMVALVGAIFGVLGGLCDRYVSGPALVLLIAAGTALVAAALSEPALVTGAMGRTVRWATPGGIRIAPLMGTQLGLAFALGACAACAVLLRSPARSLPTLVIGAVLLVLPMGAMGALAMGRTRGPLMSWLQSHVMAGALLVGIGGLILAGLLCVGVHKVIKAFEIGTAAGLVKPGTSNNGEMAQNSSAVEVRASSAE